MDARELGIPGRIPSLLRRIPQVSSVAPSLKLCIVGAAPDTGNMGVSALCYSLLAGIAKRAPDAQLTVFDNGRGVRQASRHVVDSVFHYQLAGANNSRRYYRRESYWNMWASSLFGGFGNHGLKLFLQADAILDVSGGDSFCDLYGARVFNGNIFMKQMALAHGIPLLLLPQTYGPFRQPERRALARKIITSATKCWARDRQSFAVLSDLTEDRFDPDRQICGVDLAFGLDVQRPNLPPSFDRLLHADHRPVGINVSGLIYNDPVAARDRYGFRADYREIVHQLLLRFLQQTDRTVILVPHVLARPGNVESDFAACDAALRAVAAAAKAEANAASSGRLFVLPALTDPSELKWVIAKMEWFCSTRMHSGIAALSSAVPAAAIAYSLKTAGVFESCEQGAHVADPRSSSLEDVLEKLWRSWESRETARMNLAKVLPSVLQVAERQMDQIVSTILSLKNTAVIRQHIA